METLLREDRAKVLCLAHALETHKTLSGEDIVAVMEHGQGPLVDGRCYADPIFLGRLEEYHQAAASAHRIHGNVQLSMPDPPLGAVAQGAVATLEAGPSTPNGGPGFDGGPTYGGGPAFGGEPPADAGPAPNGGWAPNDEPTSGDGPAPDGGPAPGSGWAPDGGWAPNGGPASDGGPAADGGSASGPDPTFGT